jgi:hypothetical protein
MNTCILWFIVAIALLGGTLMTCSVSREQHEKLRKTFSPELDEIYTKIVHERRNLYLQGLMIGSILALLVEIVYSNAQSKYLCIPPTRAHKVARFFGIALATTLLYYQFMPKSDYILNHLQTAEQNKAWLEMYKTMQSRYLYGMLLGALAALALANAMC